MSPVFRSFPSPTATGFAARRRARTSSALLFPVCPENSPIQRTEELAPLSGPGSGVLEGKQKGAADCPPSAPADGDRVSRSTPDFQKAAVASDAVPASACDDQAPAPLVGIARLASISPIAPTRRRSDERP